MLFWSCFFVAHRIERSDSSEIRAYIREVQKVHWPDTHTPDLGAAIWGESFWVWLAVLYPFFNFLAIFYPSVFISICLVIRFIFLAPVGNRV